MGEVRWTPGGVPVLGIAGLSGSGKTTLLEGLIGRLTERGLRVGVLKHAASGLSLDHAGTDTDRLFAAGASVVQACDDRQRLIRRREDTPPKWQALLDDAPQELDLLFIEGLKRAAIPKVWVGSEEDRAGEDVPSVIARVLSGECAEEAESVVSAWLERVWGERPWGAILVEGSEAQRTVRVGLGERPEERAEERPELPTVPGTPWPVSGLLAAMRWLPEGAWVLASQAAIEGMREAIHSTVRLRRPGLWGLLRVLRDDGNGDLLLVEPQLRTKVEGVAASGTAEAGTVRQLAGALSAYCPNR